MKRLFAGICICLVLVFASCGRAAEPTKSSEAATPETVETFDPAGDNSPDTWLGEPEDSSESSFTAMWRYEGYMDECAVYPGDAYIGRDYDHDGYTDRIYRIYDAGSQTAQYRVEFGNGRVLYVPESWESGVLHLQTGDPDADGTPEVLISVSYDASTDPGGFGSVWLFAFDEEKQEYSEVPLPLKSGLYGEKALTMDCDPPTDGLVDFRILQNGFSGSVNVGQDYLDIWWDLEWSSLDIAVSEAYFSESGNIHCLAQLFPKNSIRLEFELASDGTEYHMESMGIRNAYASCLTGDGELSVLVNGHEKRSITDGCSPAGTALLFMESNEEGHLLYCSDPAAGQMVKMLFHTKDGWKTFETEDLTTMIQGYPTGLLFTEGGIGFMTVTYHGEPIYLYRCEKDGNWIPYQMDVGETGYSYVDGEYAGRIYGKYILRLKVVTGEKDSHIRMESPDGEGWELIRE